MIRTTDMNTIINTNCFLYVDGSKESKLAQEALETRKIPYELLDLRNFKSTDVIAPRLLADEGRFEGLEDIRQYVEVFGWKYALI